MKRWCYSQTNTAYLHYCMINTAEESDAPVGLGLGHVCCSCCVGSCLTMPLQSLSEQLSKYWLRDNTPLAMRCPSYHSQSGFRCRWTNFPSLGPTWGQRVWVGPFPHVCQNSPSKSWTAGRSLVRGVQRSLKQHRHPPLEQETHPQWPKTHTTHSDEYISHFTSTHSKHCRCEWQV